MELRRDTGTGNVGVPFPRLYSYVWPVADGRCMGLESICEDFGLPEAGAAERRSVEAE